MDVEAASAATPVQVKFTGITLDVKTGKDQTKRILDCLLYTSPSPRDS